MSWRETMVLEEVQERGPVTVVEICDWLGFPERKVLTALGRLESSGLVRSDDSHPLRYTATEEAPSE
ncbi:MAG: hypothetical protein NVS3B1_28290 [Marmoricola sp.]